MYAQFKSHGVYHQSRKIVKPEPKEVFDLINQYIAYYEDEIQKTTKSEGIKSLFYSFADWSRSRQEKLDHLSTLKENLSKQLIEENDIKSPWQNYEKVSELLLETRTFFRFKSLGAGLHSICYELEKWIGTEFENSGINSHELSAHNSRVRN